MSDRLHCVAPNLRGYERSSKPTAVSAYRAKPLVADIVALLDRIGAPVDLLVAHDWGGALAWTVAAQRPDLLRRLLVINSPHPAAFLRELRHNADQQGASQYMRYLCRTDAEVRLSERDFARLWPFFGGPQGADGSGPVWLTETLRDRRDRTRCSVKGFGRDTHPALGWRAYQPEGA